MNSWTNYANIATLDAFKAMIFRQGRMGRTLASVSIKLAILQMRDTGGVSPTKVGADDNLANLITKPMTTAKFEQFCNKIFNTSSK